MSMQRNTVCAGVCFLCFRVCVFVPHRVTHTLSLYISPFFFSLDQLRTKERKILFPLLLLLLLISCLFLFVRSFFPHLRCHGVGLRRHFNIQVFVSLFSAFFFHNDYFPHIPFSFVFLFPFFLFCASLETRRSC
ncbi:hypothetical protein ABB37_05170 [Leptomonas pyrrhocoris]|uniref:Uncharacterized protein n=1 Tax=Leptomonas pyrrhocoris TaxID=157538 RepID=A0A0M9G1D0_LEPPY|nr:hypothetical protein ABB37_05170 [Leptomonas pyrrhocoris]KPA80189.1 hypothetical protein ABB37_05170 [Leptomonas pyrrhocoris]|eukprot:XP_015658628.1 hypothetical protein ABB37_05170 [Leptomonas pyrrhocoris]